MRVKMDTLQWMGAVRMRVQTADKIITIIHKWSHWLIYYEVKSNLNWSRLSADFNFGWTIPSFLSSVEHKRRYFEECCQPNGFGTYWLLLYGQKNTMEVSTSWNCLVANNILQNIIVCVPQKSKSHSGTTCEGVNDDRIFSLSGFSF